MTEQTTAAPAAGDAPSIVDKLDQIISDGLADKPAETNETPADEPAAETDPAQEPDSKAYLNALAKAKGKATKERFLRQEAEKRIAALEAQYKAPESKEKSTGAPDPKDYEGKPWADYVNAVVKFEARQNAEEQRKVTQEQTSTAERQARIHERVEHAADNSVAAAKAFADFKQVETDNMDVLVTLPETVKELLRESDNPAYAFYQLAKDGQLEQLADVSPARAALLIARAEDKALAAKKPVTKAPAPLASAKGTASGSKPLAERSPDELRKWMRE